MKKILLAGVFAGLAVFIWGMLSHMLLQIGSIGVQALPHESAVLPALSQNIKEPVYA